LSPSSQTKQVRQREDIRRRLERYVYVIEFTSGTVKVGQTASPQKRVAQHDKAAQAHRHSVVRSWVSAPHFEYATNETALIAFCEERWKVAAGREAFEAADFDSVVEYAQGLPYSRVTEDELNARVAHGDAISAGFDAALEHRVVMTKLGEFREKAELIASLTNDENRWAASDTFYGLAKEAMALTPAAWVIEDPTAAERYLISRGTAPERARKNAAEFELNFRTLYAIEYLREAESFEDIARFCDATTSGPAQQQLGGGES
jgi:predicted GIY-YIG superfamily endonuclease